MVWLFVPGLECSTKACEPHSHYLDASTGPCVTSKGKPLQPRALSASWKRNAWMRRLSGMTFSPSTADAGAVSWIASLRASHANPTVPPESAKASKMNDGSGPPSGESFATFLLGSFFSKTSAAYFPVADSKKSSDRWPSWGSMWNGECFQRPVWAPATDANGCSSWPTATVKGNYNRKGASPTSGDGLATTAMTWPTPHGMRGLDKTGKVGAGGEFAAFVQAWATPKATDGTKGGPNQRGSRGDLMLPSQSASWATPMARMHKGGGTAVTRQDGKTRMDMLDWQAESYSRQDQATADGPQSSQSAPTSRPRLNPAFGCWLMNWPAWWTNPAVTSCVQSEMALYRLRQQRHLSCLLGEPELFEEIAA